VRLEHALLPEMCEEFPSGDVLHDEIDVLAVLVHAFEIDLNKTIKYHKGVGDGLENLILVADVVDLLSLDQLDLLHYFHAVVLAVVLALDQFYPSE
jgi:hypothetical protein